jgi:23S rRNA pseudouridine1911/1915/1917 synthase
VVAKTSRALTALSEAFAAREVKKTYLAITVGNPGENVKIDKPIGRHPMHRQRMRVVPDPHQKNSRFRKMTPTDRDLRERPPSQTGRRALSFVDTLAFDGKLGLVRVKIETGRTHQVSFSSSMCLKERFT